MSLEKIIRRERSRWMDGEGPASDIVLSSRVRLARNLAGHAFPGRMDEATARRVLDEVQQAARVLDGAGSPLHRYAFMRLGDLSPLERQVLAERHLISRQHAQGEGVGAVILRDDQAVSIMVNEEDHLRIQCLFPGLSLDRCWQLASEVDDRLAAVLRFAYDDGRGYLTTCPTNTGTGLRASVMMHLPGLVLARQAGRVLGTLAKIGVTVRGLYGEGSEARGNLFQVSNQITLGPSEEDMIQNLTAVARQITDRERSTRERLYRERKHEIEDQVCRAYGTLTHARLVSSEEALHLLSQVRLGIDLNILSHVRPELFNELLIAARPGHLQWAAGESLKPQQRDARRAALLRRRLTGKA